MSTAVQDRRRQAIHNTVENGTISSNNDRAAILAASGYPRNILIVWFLYTLLTKESLIQAILNLIGSTLPAGTVSKLERPVTNN